MEPVVIKTSFKEAYRQLLFIDRFVVSESFRARFKRSLLLLGLSAAVIIVFFFSDNNFAATLIFLIPVFWICFVIYLFYAKWKTHEQRKHYLRDIAKNKTAVPHSSKLYFDNEKVTVIRNGKAMITEWEDFRAFLEEPDTIYLFQEDPYEAWSFSIKEIGKETLDTLKELARRKLPLLKSGL